MADQLQIRGGTTSENASFTGAQREITVNTDEDTLIVHDGVTPGGFGVQGRLASVNGTRYYDDDTGGGSIADAYILAAKSNTQVPTDYFGGVSYGFITTNPNNGPSTANFSGLGVKNIKLPDGSDPEAGQVDDRVDTIFDEDNDWLELQLSESGAALPVGYIDGLITSNGADVTKDIDIDVGECRDSLDSSNIVLSSILTKQIDADWAQGSNAGGFPSGLTLTADTWYHFFVISKIDGTVDGGWDTSLTATNLLADATDYTIFRLIASNLSTGSSNIKSYTQHGDIFTWGTMTQDILDLAPGTDENTGTISTPLGLIVRASINVYLLENAGTFLLVTALDQDDSTPVATNATINIANGGESENVNMNVYTDLTSKIRYRSSRGSLDDFRIATVSYEFSRGKA